MIARVSRESGLPVVLTHVPMDRILGDTEALMEEHSRFGCKNIGLGMMPKEIIVDEIKCKQKISELDKAAELMKKNGFGFFYHHHHYEFMKHGGETVLDYMISNAPNINFTADTYWLQFGGVNVCEYLGKLSGRIECVHLKDYTVACNFNEEGKPDVKPTFAPVGDGTIDMKAAVAAAKAGGAKYFLVEQDNAPAFDDPFGQAERSIKYIREVL
jgi:sugar phosphate isomerase/epimerase